MGVCMCVCSGEVLKIKLLSWVYAASIVDEAPWSSAIGVRMEVPKGVGRGCLPPHWGRDMGRGLCPLCRFFPFGSQNGEFWCILGRIFTVDLLVYHLC